MWAAGIDQTTGNPAADQRLAWNNNWQQIRAMFWQRNALGSQQSVLTRRWYVTQQGTPQVVVGQANAEIAGTMEPTMTGRTRATFSVDLLLSDPYFYGVQQSQTIPYNANTSVTNLGEGLVGEASGPFTLTFNGPLTNPTLTNTSLGISVSLGTTVAAGHNVTLDTVAYTATTDTGAREDYLVTHSGSRMWMTLDNGSNTLRLTSTNGGDTGNCVLTWKPPYL